jgi:hypothetical protein
MAKNSQATSAAQPAMARSTTASAPRGARQRAGESEGAPLPERIEGTINHTTFRQLNLVCTRPEPHYNLRADLVKARADSSRHSGAALNRAPRGETAARSGSAGGCPHAVENRGKSIPTQGKSQGANDRGP